MQLFPTYSAALAHFRSLPGCPIMRPKVNGYAVFTGTIEAEKDLKND